MRREFEPLLRPVEIASLRPTQMTVGMREVARKRAEWHKIAEREGRDFLGRQMIPAVRGPKKRLHLIDNHHLARALHEEKVEQVLVSVVADLSGLEKSEFWSFMDSRNWLHPFDAGGERRDYAALPKSVNGLVDDPYRSLAGELREAGGYSKDTTPYAEFMWAAFLRRRIDAKELLKDFESALNKALKLAHGQPANYLPGWCGPNRSPDEVNPE